MKRHPAAIARDKWFDSKEGKDTCDPLTLGAGAKQQQYLTNRLHRAFQAGYDAAVKDQLRQRLDKSMELVKEIFEDRK